jgi:hypothetical protein
MRLRYLHVKRGSQTNVKQPLTHSLDWIRRPRSPLLTSVDGLNERSHAVTANERHVTSEDAGVRRFHVGVET